MAARLRDALRPLWSILGFGACLHGCVLALPIPTPAGKPFETVEVRVEPGVTTRADLIDQIGPPAASYDAGNELVWTAFRRMWTIPGFVAVGYGYSGVAAPFLLTPGQRHYLCVHFEDGRLAALRVSTSRNADGACSDEGLCWSDGCVMRYASEAADTLAKEMAPPAGRCAVFMYFEKAPVTVSLDSVSPGCVATDDAYWYWTVEPGAHEVIVELDPRISVPFSCTGGERVFLVQEYFLGPTLGLVSPLDLPVAYVTTAEEGRAAIAVRRLAEAAQPWRE